MKKTVVSLAMAMALSSKSFAGADFVPPVIPIISVPDDIDVSGLYVGLGVSRVFFDGTCPCADGVYEDYTYGALVRVGNDFNPYFGVEFRAMSTWVDDEGARVKSHFGLFAKPQYHISDALNIYALAGYARTEIGDNRVVGFTDSGFSWGAGVEYDLSLDKKENGTYSRPFDGQGDQEKGWGLFVDYQKLIEKDGRPDIHALSFGVTYDF